MYQRKPWKLDNSFHCVWALIYSKTSTIRESVESKITISSMYVWFPVYFHTHSHFCFNSMTVCVCSPGLSASKDWRICRYLEEETFGNPPWQSPWHRIWSYLDFHHFQTHKTNRISDKIFFADLLKFTLCLYLDLLIQVKKWCSPKMPPLLICQLLASAAQLEV